MKQTLPHLLAAVLAGSAASHAQFNSANGALNFLNGQRLPLSGGEIVSFYSNPFGQDLILSTFSIENSLNTTDHGVRIHALTGTAGTGAYAAPTTINLGDAFEGDPGAWSLSSVVADNQGRDFGVATVIPRNRENSVGKAVFFKLSDGSILKSVDVGYHPDSVTLTPNGSRLVVANEGELISNTATQRAGSISVIDLSGITTANDLTSASLSASTADFQASNFGTSVASDRLDTIRTARTGVASADRYLDIEPEFVTVTDTRAYVTLQENNALAVYDFASGKYEAIHNLGTVTNNIDASDRDGASLPASGGSVRPSINVTTAQQGAPMPDAATVFEHNGQVYVATANEGDARPDDLDVVRSGRLNVTGTGFGVFNSENVLTNGVMFGTRSISIWNGDTGALVSDTDSFIETYIAANDRATFGMNQNNPFSYSATAVNNFTTGFFQSLNSSNVPNGSSSDSRSDDKGPEPESVTYGTINGHNYLFTAMERQGGIFMFNIDNPSNPIFVDYINLLELGLSAGQPYLSAESLTFVSPGNNDLGEALLIVGYENPANPGGSFAVLTIIPEPSAYAALAGLLCLGLAFRRRK